MWKYRTKKNYEIWKMKISQSYNHVNYVRVTNVLTPIGLLHCLDMLLK